MNLIGTEARLSSHPSTRAGIIGARHMATEVIERAQPATTPTVAERPRVPRWARAAVPGLGLVGVLGTVVVGLTIAVNALAGPSFVTSGVLNDELFFQTGRELLFCWERVRDLVPHIRELYKNSLEFRNLEAVAKVYIKWWNKQAPRAYEAFSKRVRG